MLKVLLKTLILLCMPIPYQAAKDGLGKNPSTSKSSNNCPRPDSSLHGEEGLTISKIEI